MVFQTFTKKKTLGLDRRERVGVEKRKRKRNLKNPRSRHAQKALFPWGD